MDNGLKEAELLLKKYTRLRDALDPKHKNSQIIGEAYNMVIEDAKKGIARAKSRNENSGLHLNSVSPCFYTKEYINWQNKYFKPCKKIYDFQRINDGEYYTKGQLHRRYEKAMLESPFK